MGVPNPSLAGLGSISSVWSDPVQWSQFKMFLTDQSEGEDSEFSEICSLPRDVCQTESGTKFRDQPTDHTEEDGAGHSGQ